MVIIMVMVIRVRMIMSSVIIITTTMPIILYAVELTIPLINETPPIHFIIINVQVNYDLIPIDFLITIITIQSPSVSMHSTTAQHNRPTIYPLI